MNIGRKLISGAFLKNIDIIVNILASFYIMPFLIHTMGDKWYGFWVIIASFMGYYGLLDLGLSSATRRYLAMYFGKEEENNINIVLNTSLVIFSLIAIFSIAITGVIIILAPTFVKSPSEVILLRKVLIIMGIDIAIAFPLRIFTPIIAINLRYEYLYTVSLLKTLIRTSLIILLVKDNNALLTLALITIFSNILQHTANFSLAKKIFPSMKISLRFFDKDKVRQFVNYSKYTFLAQIGDMIRFKMDLMVIAYFLGSVLVTHYNIALRLHQYSNQLTIGLLSVSFPVLIRYYAQKDFVNMREKFLLITRFGLLITVGLSGAVIILATPFINLWVGEIYLTAILPLVILRSISFLGGGQNASVQIMYAMAKHRFYALITICEAVANLLISILLVREFGIVGVALGTAIPFIINKLFIMPPYVCRLLDIPTKQYYLQMVTLVSYAAAGHIPFYLIVKYFNVGTYTSMIISGGLYYSVYAIYVLRFILSDTDRIYLTDALPILQKTKLLK